MRRLPSVLVLAGTLIAMGATALHAQDTTGDINRQAIRVAIAQRMPAIRACYERALAIRPVGSGRITITFTILPNGKVGSVTLRDTELNDPPTEQCVLGVIRALRFPPHPGPGNVTIHYPLVFRSD